MIGSVRHAKTSTDGSRPYQPGTDATRHASAAAAKKRFPCPEIGAGFAAAKYAHTGTGANGREIADLLDPSATIAEW